MCLQRLCLECDALFPASKGVSRCPTCRSVKEKARDTKRGSAKDRGFDQEYQRKRAALLNHPFPRCELCGSTDKPTVDHIIPRSKGGTNDAWNLRILCQRCNYGRGNRSDAEYINSKVIGPA